MRRFCCEAGIGSCAVAPHGIPVEIRTGADALAGCAITWPSSSGGCDTPAMVAAAEAETGLTLSSFAGCNTSTAFSID